MNRSVLDPRVWLPVLGAVALFVLRERPAADVAGAAPRLEVVTLPAVRASVPPLRDQDFELDGERSTVRFAIDGASGPLVVACPLVEGKLALRRDERQSELQLKLDLASLQILTPGADPGELRELLGVRGSAELGYVARLQQSGTCGVPGVRELFFVGTMRCDDRVVQQPMVLWQPVLPGQPTRLQGHGTVSTAPYHLPARGWFGFARQSHVVTLGLDLVWKRPATR